MKENKKIIHVSHSDSDGIGCTVLSQYYGQKMGYEVECYNVGYSKVAETLISALKYVEVHPEDVSLFLISDISMREDSGIDKIVDNLSKRHPKIQFLLLDHHDTAKWLNKYPWAQVETCDNKGVKHCGTYLVNEFYKMNSEEHVWNNEAVKQLVYWTDLYDTWRWVEDFPVGEPFTPANDLNRLMLFKGIKGQSKALLQRLKKNSTIFVNLDKIPTKFGDNYLFTQSDFDILASSDANFEDLVATKEKEMITGDYTFRINTTSQLESVQRYFKNLYKDSPKQYKKAISKFSIGYKKHFKVGVVYADKNISELGNTLAKSHPELDFICLINMPTTVSYRCEKDLEVPLGIIANDFSRGKGGGHPKSSGSGLSSYLVDITTKQLLPGFSTRIRG